MNTPYYQAPPEPSDAELLALAHAHGYLEPPESDALIVALMRVARNWRPRQEFYFPVYPVYPFYYIPKVTC